MFTPTLASEFIAFSTVRISVSDHARTGEGLGTGFFFFFKADEQHQLPCIVTNKHVVKGAAFGKFQLHERKKVDSRDVPSGAFFPVELDDFEDRWVAHPDPEVDLCAMHLKPLCDAAEGQGKHPFVLPFTEEIIPTEETLLGLGAVEDILMVGYPKGLWDDVNNMPIIRRGITAVHPSLRFQGKSMGVIDAACYPGSSGSPVLIVNEGSFTSKSAALTVGNRVILLGVLFAGPVMEHDGSIRVHPVPTTVTSLGRLPINLGYYVKSRELPVLGEELKRRLVVN